MHELIEIAGGDPIFPHLAAASLAKDRIVSADAVRDAAPEIIFASWCGKKVQIPRIAGRAGWSDIPAVADHRIYEIKSTYILQPGPASLTDGVRQLHERIAEVTTKH